MQSGEGVELDYELVRSSEGGRFWRNKRTGETRTTVAPSGGADLEDMRKRIRSSVAELSERIRCPAEETPPQPPEGLAPAWASLWAAVQPGFPQAPAQVPVPEPERPVLAWPAMPELPEQPETPMRPERLAPAWDSLRAALDPGDKAALALCPPAPATPPDEEAPPLTSELPLHQQLEVQQAAMAAQVQQFMMQQHFHAQMRKIQRQATADKNAGSGKASGGGSSAGAQPAPSERWVCSECGFYNRISNRWCGGNGHLGCKIMRMDDAEIIKPSLLRPNAVPTIPEEARRYGDWNCPACGDYQFRRNPTCRTCGTLKPTEAPLDGIEPPPDPPTHGR
mmetsp:Transcript_25238/g.72775  ORF Transcript_25238/g.72775 Transcript_25238/m.72775 type:complete len:337 (-) Transcript_25238:8-1018(-)